MRATATVLALLAAASIALAGDALDDLRSADPEARARGRAALAAAGSDELLQRALADASGPVRAAAASVLAGAPARATPVLRAALRDLLRDRAADRSARAAAALALGAAKDAAAAGELRAALADFPAEASLALADLGDPGPLPDLRRVASDLGGDAPPETGYALALLGDPAGEDLLLAHLVDERASVATAALHLLRRLTGEDLGPALGAWKEAVRVRRLGVALGERDREKSEAALNEAIARGATAGADFLRVLRGARSTPEARAGAALGLGLLGHAEAGPDLLAASRPGQDPFVRVYAIEALGRIAWAPAAPDLARMLVNDEDAEVQRSFYESRDPFCMVQPAAARALLAMGCDGAMAAIVDELSIGGTFTLPTACVAEFRVRVYWEALAILRDHGGPGAADGFGFVPEASPAERAAAGARAVAWWNSRPRDLAVKRRGRFDDPGFVAGVNREIRILGEYKFLEMDRSRRALILLGGPAVPHLAAAVASTAADDPSGQRRIGAAQVLGSIGSPDGVAPLRAAFARAELLPVRLQALRSLAAIGPPEGVPEAVALLASSNADERGAAAEALALSPTPGGAAAAARVLQAADLDPALRVHLATARLAGRDPGGLPVLLGYLADADVVLRRRAWAGIDRWTVGLGPFDPESGAGVDEVRARGEAWTAKPRWSTDPEAPR